MKQLCLTFLFAVFLSMATGTADEGLWRQETNNALSPDKYRIKDRFADPFANSTLGDSNGSQGVLRAGPKEGGGDSNKTATVPIKDDWWIFLFFGAVYVFGFKKSRESTCPEPIENLVVPRS